LLIPKAPQLDAEAAQGHLERQRHEHHDEKQANPLVGYGHENACADE
jgi:hypothetical protein